MRVKMKFGKSTVIAFNEFKKQFYKDENIEITNGYVLKVAYTLLIENELDNIDWVRVNKKESEIVRRSNVESVEGVHTTLTIESDILEGINKLQNDFKTEFKTTRVYRSFVVKLIMFAALLHLNDELPRK